MTIRFSREEPGLEGGGERSSISGTDRPSGSYELVSLEIGHLTRSYRQVAKVQAEFEHVREAESSFLEDSRCEH
jgi:hypothetical protein